MRTMKAFLLGGAVSFGLTLAMYAQSPTISPEPPAPSPSPALAPSSPSPAASARPAASLSPANEFGDKIKQKVDRKLKHKGFDITIDGSDEDEHGTVHGNGDIPRSVVPIVVVTMLAI